MQIFSTMSLAPQEHLSLVSARVPSVLLACLVSLLDFCCILQPQPAGSKKAKAGPKGTNKASPETEEAKPAGDPVGRTRAAKQAPEAEPPTSPKPAEKCKKREAKDAKLRSDPAGRTRAAKPAEVAESVQTRKAGRGKKRGAEPPTKSVRVTRARGS